MSQRNGDRPRRTRTIPPPLAPPFPRAVPTWVGRGAELARAADLFERETLHLVYGVGGVGKSEFVYRLFDEVRERPAWAVAPAVLVGVRPGMAAEHVVAALRVNAGPRRPRIQIQSTGTATLDDDLAEAARVLDAAPVMVFLDDVHNLEPEAAARVLGFLSRHVRTSRIVAASRIEIPLPPGTPPPAVHRLGPLDEGATADLVARLAERLGVAPPDAAAVFPRSGGSPFYVARDVAGDPDRASGGLDQTLRELPDAARALVAALAVARTPLAPKDVAELAGDEPLRELGRRFLVDGLRDQVLVHDLVRDASHRIASRRERAAAHRRMADLYRGRAEKDGRFAPADAGDVVEAVHHLTAAGDAEEAWELVQGAYRPVAAAGLDHLLLDDLRTLGGAVAGAREAIALMTARILIRRSLIAEAADVLAGLTDRGEEASPRWLLLAGEVAERRGRLVEAQALFRRAQAVAVTPAERLQAALELADAASLRGRNDEAREVLAAARVEHEPLAPRDRGRWGWSQTLSYIIEERFAEAAAEARAAAEALEGGGHEDLEVLLALLEVLARAELDDVAGASALLDRVVARATAVGALREHVSSLYGGVLAYFAGDLDAAAASLDHAFAYLTDHADFVMASIGGYYRVRVHIARGEIVRALELAARMTRLATSAELGTLAPHGRIAQAEALLAAGRPDEARALIESGLAAPRVCDQARWRAHTMLARAAAADGDLARRSPPPRRRRGRRPDRLARAGRGRRGRPRPERRPRPRGRRDRAGRRRPAPRRRRRRPRPPPLRRRRSPRPGGARDDRAGRRPHRARHRTGPRARCRARPWSTPPRPWPRPPATAGSWPGARWCGRRSSAAAATTRARRWPRRPIRPTPRAGPSSPPGPRSTAPASTRTTSRPGSAPTSPRSA